ncbi:MAG: type III-B CRISPR module-associated protein Cmr5 [Candidatus Methanofastidiosa archaeon]|nr:type III-B CRISPR module-associated protein Cmr5 [Candidatus Methanofastidiosa archaeon]
MNNTITIIGLERGRAKFAYDCALDGSARSKKKEYKSYVKKIPMLIKTNGLGSTFAFIKSKSTNDENKAGYAYYLIYKQTKEWLKKDDKSLVNLNENDDLLEKIISLDSPSYRSVTNEVLAFFKWVSRFAEGLIEGEVGNE